MDCSNCSSRSCATKALTPKQLQQLSKYCCEITYKAKESLVLSGTFTGHVIYIKEGIVKEHLAGPMKKDQITKLLGPSTYLGLESIFGDRVNHYSYTAIENTTVCLIDKYIFKNLIRQNGKFAYEILVALSKDSLFNIHHFINLNQKQIYGRLSDTLLYLSKIIYRSNNFKLSFSRKELADMMCTTRESAIRALQRFHNEGIIQLEGKNIEILKPERLESISDFG
jgi:CRP/FNR family transcriptional regulator